MRRNIFYSLTLIALMACPLPPVFAAGEVAIYTGEVGWISKEGADKQARICIDRLNAAGIPNILFDSDNDSEALANWMKNTTGDGGVDVCILYGNFPSSIYPTANALPDGSIAETFIETTDGDAFINHADYMFWGAGRNQQGGLENMMDIAGITMWGDHTPMTVTDAGKSIAPSLTDFVSHRPFHVDALAGDWAVEAVLARNHNGTRADPIIVRDGNRGRLIPIMQTVGDDNPQGAVAAEVISYLMSKTLNTTVTVLPEDVNQDPGVSIADPIDEAQVTGQPVSEVFAQQQVHPIVRLIYFYPSDREPLPDIDEKMDRLIKDTQQFYADQMETHGFDRKTFLFETDTQGWAVIHHVKGRFSHRDYQNDWQAAWQEARKRFDGPNSFLFTVLDVDLEGITPCGRGGGNGRSGGGFVTAQGWCFNVNTIAHELGHAFGLQHDYTRTNGKWIPSKYSSDRMMTSFCAAEWLDVIPIFNTGATPINHNTTIKILPPNLASLPNIIRFSFEVNDLDGIQQVQFFTIEPSQWTGSGLEAPSESVELADYKGLKGNSDYTGEFFTTQVKHKNKMVIFQSIDVHGNMAWQEFPVNITSLLPPPKVVLIPDPHLASVVRDKIGSITTHTMLDLTALVVRNHGIKDLTGLEHAHNLKRLVLGGEYIDGGGWANSNVVSDISPLAGLSQLTYLGLSDTGTLNISELADLTQLTELHLSDNNISDISPLADLTQLTSLHLGRNNISGLSPLSGLTQLGFLYLGGNNITDVAPLAGLAQLDSLYLGGNNISDLSPLSGLTQLGYLSLAVNNITDVAPLAGLTQLTSLHLFGNNTSDISVLSGLTQLTSLHLSSNNISDISPLTNLTQLQVLNLSYNLILDVSPLVGLDLPGTQWDSTGLRIIGNPLNYASIHTHIPVMQAKGVEVKFDNRAHSALAKISGDTQEGEANTTLANPFVVEALDEHGVPITGLGVTFRIIEGNGKLRATTATTDANGKAQTTLTLGPNPGVIKVRVAAAEIAYPVTFTATATEASRHAADVNGDGTVNIQDLVLVSSNFGQTGENAADVNGDGVVNISDLVLVAGAFGEGAAAAPTLHASDIDGLTAAEIQNMLTQARQMALTDPAYLRGIAVLEQLLDFLLPKETVLLPNYPNPFNPETWIPYRLAKPAEVSIAIYTADGILVRTLGLGHQGVGIYKSRSRAAYWNGKNEVGEPVASGVYFYTLTAGDFTATRKMLIRK